MIFIVKKIIEEIHCTKIPFHVKYISVDLFKKDKQLISPKKDVSNYSNVGVNNLSKGRIGNSAYVNINIAKLLRRTKDVVLVIGLNHNLLFSICISIHQINLNNFLGQKKHIGNGQTGKDITTAKPFLKEETLHLWVLRPTE